MFGHVEIWGHGNTILFHSPWIYTVAMFGMREMKFGNEIYFLSHFW